MLKITISKILKEEEGKQIKLYHVSSESGIERFSAKYSKKNKEKGIFLTPDKDSIFRSWAAWARSKFRGTNKEKLKKGKINYDDKSIAYHNLTIYTLSMPENIYKEILNNFIKKQEEAFEKYGNLAFGAWGWDSEIFIPEQYIKFLKIIGRKTYHPKEIINYRTKTKDISDHLPDNSAVKFKIDMERKIADYVLKNGNLEHKANLATKVLNKLNKFIYYNNYKNMKTIHFKVLPQNLRKEFNNTKIEVEREIEEILRGSNV